MENIDGFRTTDSFLFDRNTSSSSVSLSSSSGYGSRLSLSQTDNSSSNRRIGLTKYFKEKLSRHKSLASIHPLSTNQNDIYESVWNLDEQINKIRLNINKRIYSDCQSIISMSVDIPEQIDMNDDHDLLSVAPWYQEGLPRNISEEYLNDIHKPIGSFLIRRSFTYPKYRYVLSIKTKLSTIEHFLIEQIVDNNTYRLQGSSKTFKNLSTLILHHTVMPDILPVTLVLPLIHSTSTPIKDIYRQRSSLNIVRSVRF